MDISEVKIISDALSLPIYLYRGRQLVYACPEQAERYQPPTFYLTRALAGDFTIPLVTTSQRSVFGLLSVEKSEGQFLMIGPVAQIPYGREEYWRIFSDYRISAEEREDCVTFFHSIPCYLTEDFSKILLMIHHFLGNRSEPDFHFFKNMIPTARLRKYAFEGVSEQNSLSKTNESLVYEKILTDIIERGQTKKIEEMTTDFFNFNMGWLAENPLRNMKNIIISGITLFTRAAIRGGVPSQLAFQISDIHIRNLENCRTADAAADQFIHALTVFTEEVAKIRKQNARSGCFEEIIRYIREHTDAPLSVSHIAAEFGYNSNYLSGAFKKELGFSLSAYILRTKLEAAREFLQYTDKSILEISEYLCFSSQSYFQTVFRKQYGMTPLSYRKENKRGQASEGIF